MKKILLMKQPAGLGDILFTQKIAHHFKDSGYRVLWPVFDSFADISNYIPDFEFYGISTDFPFKDEFLKVKDGDQTIHFVEDHNLFIIPIDSSGGGDEIMKTKYNFIGLDWRGWQDYLKFNRNVEKENKLFYEILGLKDGEKYTFTMKYIGSPPNHLTKINLNFTTDNRIVYLDLIPGYSLFDWCKVIEEADEIFIEGSAAMYLVEVLNTKANKLILFSRDDHRHFNGILNKPWILDKGSINMH